MQKSRNIPNKWQENNQTDTSGQNQPLRREYKQKFGFADYFTCFEYRNIQID